jgi:hypothetical protein
LRKRRIVGVQQVLSRRKGEGGKKKENIEAGRKKLPNEGFI